MIDIDVPGFGRLMLDAALIDFNGTLARDGVLHPGVADRLRSLSGSLELHVATADTHDNARSALARLPVALHVLEPTGQADAKRRILAGLDYSRTAAIGNGRNDRAMLADAALSIAVCGAEGCAVEALSAAHVVCRDACEALDLLLLPRRLIATLRD
ncbi:MAG TPA: ATPase P [Casimicrobiaceae bacterium]|jgi:soluble P-type ATPase